MKKFIMILIIVVVPNHTNDIIAQDIAGVAKIGLDILGKHKSSILDKSSKEDVEDAICFGSELTSSRNAVDFGMGVEYQIQRSQSDFDGDFKFISIFGLAKIFQIHPSSKKILCI